MNRVDVISGEKRFPEQDGSDAAPLLAAARRALYRWAEVISSGRVEDLLALYASDAILVPTVSDEIGSQPPDLRRYFDAFLACDGMQCTIGAEKERVSRKLGTVVIGGLYEFRFRRAGVEQVVPARFLFTFEEIDGQWLITGHHSSRLSEAL